MVERKLFKTKLCDMFWRSGHCSRTPCSFAHGESELRRFSGSFRGKRDFGIDDLRDKHFGNGDLREKLDRMRSPRRVHSPVRDTKGRNTDHEPGPSRSPPEKERKKQRLDDQSDVSGSLRILDGVEHEAKSGKLSTHSRDVRVEQLRHVELDLNKFDQQKCELQMKLEGMVQEVESHNSKIQELETQLNKEKEENQRILSKINNFVKAYNHHTTIQDQLKKSEDWLHKLGGDLGSDVNKISCNEEDLRVSVVSEDEASGSPLISNNKKQNGVWKSNERQEGNSASRESKQVDSAKVHVKTPVISKKVSRWNIPEPSYDKEIEAVVHRNGQPSHVPNENKHDRRDQTRSTVSKLALPPTINGPRADEEVEIELEVNHLPSENPTTSFENRDTHENNNLPFTLPPQLPIMNTDYSQYEGDDERIDVDGSDDNDMIVYV